MRTLTQFRAVVVECARRSLSLARQFCLKRHPGNLEMLLSEAGGPNLTGMWLQQEDPAEESRTAEDLRISHF